MLEESCMEFIKDGKKFVAGKGFLYVYDVDTEKNLLSAFDIFQNFNEEREKYTEDFIIECYKTLSRIFEEEFNNKGD